MTHKMYTQNKCKNVTFPTPVAKSFRVAIYN